LLPGYHFASVPLAEGGTSLRRASWGIAVVLALLPSPYGEDRRGSLVVLVFSKNSDYIVAAAESRELDRSGKPINDRGCKVIAVGNDTLFFATGFYRIANQSGVLWNALTVAGAVYKASNNHDALSLSDAWANRAFHWLRQLPEQDLEALTEKTDRIVTGGFISFGRSGIPSAHYQKLGYSRDEHRLIRLPDSEAALPGQVWAIGSGQELLTEFLDGKTKRAIEALDPKDASRLASADPAMSSNLARKAIQFAMDNTTGAEKGSLGGPIDTAILRRNGTIEWVSRKRECYKIDQDQNNSNNPPAH
jgi:hypothetical protein